MLSAFAHDSCKAILFRTETGLRNATTLVLELNLQPQSDRFLSKCHVLPPSSCMPLSIERVGKKWTASTELRVVFCGRDYRVKNGGLALTVFGRVIEEGLPVELTYIGEIPAPEAQRFAEVLRRVHYYPRLSHERVMDVFARSHVLFHPSTTEAFGLVFVEACAYALVIITAAGPGMEHTRELFGSGGAFLVDRSVHSIDAELEQYVLSLRILCGERAMAADMASRNYRLSTVGTFSLEKRNERLSHLYDAALRDYQTAPLSCNELTQGSAPVLRLSERQLALDLEAYLMKTGQSEHYVVADVRSQF